METTGEKLRLLRLQMGKTQGEVASQIGVDRSTYSYYELGRTSPDWNMIKRLAKFFNVSYYALLEDENKYILGDSVRSQNFEDLNFEERALILKFRSLPLRDRKKLIEFLKSLL